MKDYGLFISENTLRRKIARISKIAIGCFIAFFLVIALAFYFFNSSTEKTNKNYVFAEIEKASSLVSRFIVSDFSLLRTIRSFTDDPVEMISNYQNQTQSEGNFETIAFFSKSNASKVLIQSNRIYDITKALENPIIKKAITDSLEGKETISAPYYADSLQKYVVRLSVPVFNEDNEITGCISASRDISDYVNFLKVNVDDFYSLDLILVDKYGNVISSITSIKSAPDKDLRSLKDFPSVKIDPNAEQVFLNNLNDGKDKAYYEIEGENYGIKLYKVHIPDTFWYVLAIDRAGSIYSNLDSYLLVFIYILIGFALVFLLLGVFFYLSIKKSIAKEMKLLFYDRLTGCWSMTKLRKRLEFVKYQNEKYALVYFNIKNFGFVNESIGINNANNILKQIPLVASKYKVIVGVARDSADRFYMLLRIENRGALFAWWNLFVKDLKKHSDEYITNISFNGGVAFSSVDDNYYSFIHKAQFALKQVKASYDNEIIFYDESLYKLENKQFVIEKSMKQAILNGEFKLYLQPQFNVKSNELEGAEALVRWVTESGKSLMPDEFIPLFEQNGFCVELDLYMLELCCQRMSSWVKQGIDNCRLSVNQSKLILFKPNYISRVETILNTYPEAKNRITVEILEEIAVKNIDKFNEYISSLKTLGLKVSLDDFGSGYSSLNVLSSLKVDEIKFDKTFLLESNNSKKQKNKVMLTSLVRICNTFKLSTVVEGVENKEDLDFLATIDSNKAQGYLFSKPIPVEDFENKYFDIKK